MRKRTILYLLIAAWALLMLNGYYGVHDYVSLEGFPDVQVLNTRRISSGRFIQFGQEVPVEYAIVRDGYEIRIYIRETRNVPASGCVCALGTAGNSLVASAATRCARVRLPAGNEV